MKTLRLHPNEDFRLLNIETGEELEYTWEDLISLIKAMESYCELHQ